MIRCPRCGNTMFFIVIKYYGNNLLVQCKKCGFVFWCKRS